MGIAWIDLRDDLQNARKLADALPVLQGPVATQLRAEPDDSVVTLAQIDPGVAVLATGSIGSLSLTTLKEVIHSSPE